MWSGSRCVFVTLGSSGSTERADALSSVRLQRLFSSFFSSSAPTFLNPNHQHHPSTSTLYAPIRFVLQLAPSLSLHLASPCPASAPSLLPPRRQLFPKPVYLHKTSQDEMKNTHTSLAAREPPILYTLSTAWWQLGPAEILL